MIYTQKLLQITVLDAGKYMRRNAITLVIPFKAHSYYI